MFCKHSLFGVYGLIVSLKMPPPHDNHLWLKLWKHLSFLDIAELHSTVASATYLITQCMIFVRFFVYNHYHQYLCSHL